MPANPTPIPTNAYPSPTFQYEMPSSHKSSIVRNPRKQNT